VPLKRGNTYFDRGVNGHLWIILAGPDNDGVVVVVSITTRRAKSDLTTICAAGDHPFIERASVVAYSYAQELVATEIECNIKTGVFQLREDCSDALLDRIAKGLIASNRASLRVQNTFVRITKEGTE
jgi:hypothetical protein